MFCSGAKHVYAGRTFNWLIYCLCSAAATHSWRRICILLLLLLDPIYSAWVVHCSRARHFLYFITYIQFFDIHYIQYTYSKIVNFGLNHSTKLKYKKDRRNVVKICRKQQNDAFLLHRIYNVYWLLLILYYNFLLTVFKFKFS